MAKKPTVTTISSGYASNTQLNNNFEALRDGFDNTLSLDGSTPNAMNADLDLNDNDILNANEINTDSLVLGGISLTANNIGSSSYIFKQNFTGTGSQTVFTLSATPTIVGIGTNIYIDGVYQEKDTYTINGTTLTFSEAPPLNASIEVLVFRVSSLVKLLLSLYNTAKVQVVQHYAL